MSFSVRNLTTLIASAVMVHVNKLRLDILRIRAGVTYHADATPSSVTTANATDLPSSIALITALQVAYVAHIASACDPTTGLGAHIAADATNVLSAATPTDLASCETAVNEIKTKFNAHIASTSFHAAADSADTISTANATDLASTEALANACKTALNAHFAAAMNSQGLVIVAP